MVRQNEIREVDYQVRVRDTGILLEMFGRYEVADNEGVGISLFCLGN